MSTSQQDIRVKRAYLPAAPDDGARILVDRLWPRGLSKLKAALSLWCKDIAPSTGLRQWLHQDPDRWPQFVARYQAELNGQPQAVQLLVDYARQGTLTLIYASHEPEHNHARVLAAYLQAMLARPVGIRP